MNFSPDTAVLQTQKDQYGATQFPVYLNAAFAYDSPDDLEKVFEGTKFGYIYGRIQNPTLMNLEQKIARFASLPNSPARGAVLTTTGMAALSGAILTLVSAEDSIVVHNALFGGTIALFNYLFAKLGIRIVYANFHNAEELQRAITSAQNPRLLFCEIMGNPALDLQDINALGNIAQQNEIPLLLDSTLAPPGFLDLSAQPVALEMHSTTKYICGNGSLLGGVLIDRGTFDWSRVQDKVVQDFAQRFGRENAFLAAFRFQALQNLGMTQQPLAATIAGLSLESMSLRVERCFANTEALARTVEEYASEIKSGSADDYAVHYAVHYPGLPTSPYYERAKKLMKRGAGGLFTIDFGTKERAYRFGRALKLARNMTNLGDARTLVLHPESTIFRDSTTAQKKLAGVSPGLIRVSVGLENIDDLKSDFIQALEAV